MCPKPSAAASAAAPASFPCNTVHEWRLRFDSHHEDGESLLASCVAWMHINNKSRSDFDADYRIEIQKTLPDFCKDGVAINPSSAYARCAKDKTEVPEIYKRWQSTNVQFGRLEWTDDKKPVVKEITGKDGITRIATVYKAKKAKAQGDTVDTITLKMSEVQEWFDKVRGGKTPPTFLDFCVRFDLKVKR